MKSQKKLGLRPIGRGFIISNTIPGGPAGRSLAMAYVDSKNQKYVEIKGNIEPLKDHHGFLAVD